MISKKLFSTWTWVSREWNEFFFKPTSPATLGLFRIIFGLVVLVAMIGKFPVRELFYGDIGFVTEQAMSHYIPNSYWFFRWIPGTEPGLTVYFLGILLVSFSFMIGFFTRTSSVLLFLALISLSNRNMFVDNSGDDLMRINAFWLMFAPSGAAYSVDRWHRIKRGVPSTHLEPMIPWAQRMMQLQLAFLYINTFWLKLPGQEWKDGTAIYYALNYLELRRFELKPLFYFLWQIKLATYLTLVAEAAAGTLIWFKRFRYPVMAMAFLLHFGINLALQFPVFQYVMMASLVNFFYPDDVEKWITNRLARIKKGDSVATAPKF